MTDILSAEEIASGGKAIVKDYGLGAVSYTREDVKLVWQDFLGESDMEITRLAVRESITALRERYDLRRLRWLRDWYCRYSELESIFGRFPRDMDLRMFFTIRGPADLVNAKNTTLYSCLMYLLELEVGKERRKLVRERKETGGKISVDFSVLGVRRKTKEWMQDHPEEVEAVKRKYGR